jgi:hypothetical protein
MNLARVAAHGWAMELHAALRELVAARLRWCVVCGRLGLWGWRPLCPSMAISWVCVDRARCRDAQVVRVADAGWPRPAHRGCGSPQAAVLGVSSSIEAACVTSARSQRRGGQQ